MSGWTIVVIWIGLLWPIIITSIWLSIKGSKIKSPIKFTVCGVLLGYLYLIPMGFGIPYTEIAPLINYAKIDLANLEILIMFLPQVGINGVIYKLTS